MTDRIVVLKADDPVSFVAEACAALADAVNEIRIQRRGDVVLVKAYAEMVVAYAQLLRPELSAQGDARLAIIDHLVMRLRQAQADEITMSVQEIVDRLHGELTRELVSA